MMRNFNDKLSNDRKKKTGVKNLSASIAYSINDRAPENSDQLYVIGAGLMRTGTTSLKEALEILYCRPCYHMSTVFGQYKQKHIKQWLRRFSVQNVDENENMEFWKKIYEGCSMAVDYPTCAFYRELMKVYPNSKVILTIREREEWVESVKGTILSAEMLYQPTISERFVYWWRGIRNLPDLHDAMFKKTLGYKYAAMNEVELGRAFDQWNAEVQECVPKERLLVFQLGMGWKPLCEFLGVQQPAGVPFPHASKRETMRQNLNGLVKQGQQANRVLSFLIVTVLVTSFGILTFTLKFW